VVDVPSEAATTSDAQEATTGILEFADVADSAHALQDSTGVTIENDVNGFANVDSVIITTGTLAHAVDGAHQVGDGQELDAVVSVVQHVSQVNDGAMYSAAVSIAVAQVGSGLVFAAAQVDDASQANDGAQHSDVVSIAAPMAGDGIASSAYVFVAVATAGDGVSIAASVTVPTVTTTTLDSEDVSHDVLETDVGMVLAVS